MELLDGGDLSQQRAKMVHGRLAVLLKTRKGVIVVTGCSHPGVGTILNAASCHGAVYGIIGGLHGFHDFDRLDGLSLVCPCHCTQYKSELRRLFPNQYVTCGAGLELELY